MNKLLIKIILRELSANNHEHLEKEIHNYERENNTYSSIAVAKTYSFTGFYSKSKHGIHKKVRNHSVSFNLGWKGGSFIEVECV